MLSALNLTHFLGILLAVTALWAVRFETRRQSIVPWRLFLPAVLILLCSLALLGDLNTRGKEVWLIGFGLGIPFGMARAFWLRLRTDHAAKLVRLSPVRDALVVVVAAIVLAAIEAAMALHTAGGENKPMFAAAVALCAGYLGGRAVITRVRAGGAIHLDMR